MLLDTLKELHIVPQDAKTLDKKLIITPELKARYELASKLHQKYAEFFALSTQFKDGKYTKQMASELILPIYEETAVRIEKFKNNYRTVWMKENTLCWSLVLL